MTFVKKIQNGGRLSEHNLKIKNNNDQFRMCSGQFYSTVVLFRFSECAGCKEELKEGQALIALERQWHIWCFKCGTCGQVLHGEYMGRDGVPYCERDYQKQFGVKCAYCTRYISGKVLQVRFRRITFLKILYYLIVGGR